MSSATYYVQPCPTCGRRLQIRVEYLGRALVCQHCGGHFLARDPEITTTPSISLHQNVMERADHLLSGIDQPPPQVTS